MTLLTKKELIDALIQSDAPDDAPVFFHKDGWVFLDHVCESVETDPSGDNQSVIINIVKDNGLTYS